MALNEIHTVVTKNGKQKLPVKFLVPVDAAKILPEKIGRFASVLAHEVRNPLSNIKLAVDMLKMADPEGEQKKYLDIIMRGYARINDLITDLLVLQQPVNGVIEISSMHDLLEDVLAMTRDRIELKHIMVIKAYTTMDCRIMVDRQKLKLALTNIIINAIDAMNGADSQLKIVTKSLNGSCLIEIEDNGIGISKENLKYIFKPYFTNKLGGMGLGLSASLQILKANRATVKVRSTEGKGTRFVVSFPDASIKQ